LTATAMMVAGWDGAPKKHAPGFPDDGTWQVRWENLRPLPQSCAKQIKAATSTQRFPRNCTTMAEFGEFSPQPT